MFCVTLGGNAVEPQTTRGQHSASVRGNVDLVNLGFVVCFWPGAAYTCLEAATGRALLRQHMNVSGEENPLNKLRVKIEPGPEGSPVFLSP